VVSGFASTEAAPVMAEERLNTEQAANISSYHPVYIKDLSPAEKDQRT